MFQKFDIDDSDIYKACVVATMSCGKSTFINAIIGEEIMPEKNEACTARTMAVIDNDNAAGKKAHIIRKNGAKEVVEINNRDVLDQINNDEDVADFLVETDISGISNTSKALVLIDTPGVNNSGDERHGQRTEDLLKQMGSGLIIYLLNATQLATNDDSLLLDMVSDLVKNNSATDIIFVLNKIDALDEETESISNTVHIARDYIESHGVSNPVLFPVSARAAKLLKMAFHKKEMTRREKRSLEEIYDNYKPGDNSMLSYALTGDGSDEVFEIGDEKVSGQELHRAIENTGILAIEKKVEAFMSRSEKTYSPRVFMKASFDDAVSSSYEKTLKEISSLKNGIHKNLFRNLFRKLSASEAMGRINQASESFSTCRAQIAEEDLSEYRFEDLVADALTTKRKIEDSLSEGRLMKSATGNNLYFMPDVCEQTPSSVKDFYLISSDLNVWSVVDFPKMEQKLQQGESLYIRNPETGYCTNVSFAEKQNIIAFLDMNLPLIRIQTGTLTQSETCSVEEITEYIELENKKLEDSLASIRKNEDQLKRTYRGIVFSSVEERNMIVDQEKLAQEYCLSADGKNYMDLADKKEELSQFPSAIFSAYVAQILVAMEEAEKREISLLLDKIAQADLDGLGELSKNRSISLYSEKGRDEINQALSLRERLCQKQILKQMTESAGEMSRKELFSLKENIQVLSFPETIKREYLYKIDKLFDKREREDIAELCGDISAAVSADSLKNILHKLHSGPFRKAIYGEYEARILERINILDEEYLHNLCRNIEQSNREQTDAIRDEIAVYPCEDNLKTVYMERIKKRIRILDQKELDTLTDDLPFKDLNELQKIYEKLHSEEYEAFSVDSYVQKTRIYLEQAEKKHVNSLLSELESMSRTELSDLEHRIQQLKYPDYITDEARQRIYNRKIEIDLERLIQMENDFDSLSKSDLERLRSKLDLMDLVSESKQAYLDKLKEREKNIALSKISPFCCYARQSVDRTGMNYVPGICITTFTDGYMNTVDDFQRRCSVKDVSEIPIIIFQNDIYLAISQVCFYAKTRDGILRCPVSEVDAVHYVKKRVVTRVEATLRDGRIFSLSGTVDKKIGNALTNLINEVILSVKMPERTARYKPYEAHVAKMTRDDVLRVKKPILNDVSYWGDQFIQMIMRHKDDISFFRKFHFSGMQKWNSDKDTALKNMEITEESNLILYYDASRLNNAKEGFAVGEKGFYEKISDRNTVFLPISGIVSVTENNRKDSISIKMTDRYIYNVRSVNMRAKEIQILADALSDYVNAVQLLLMKEGTMNPEAPRFTHAVNTAVVQMCPGCGKENSIDNKFCKYCGTKLVI